MTYIGLAVLPITIQVLTTIYTTFRNI